MERIGDDLCNQKSNLSFLEPKTIAYVKEEGGEVHRFILTKAQKPTNSSYLIPLDAIDALL